MHEKQKIDEAAYFLGKMRAAVNDPPAFKHEFSAFISAARSALQYALEEAKPKPGGLSWFDTTVANRPLVPYFRDKRNTNIHEKPVPPKTTAVAKIENQLGLSNRVMVELVQPDGTKTRYGPAAVAEPAPEQGSNVSVTYAYSFDDWPSSESVEALCEAYLNDVRAVVAEGMSRRYVTG